MNFTYCKSCYNHFKEKWAALESGFLVGAPVSVCVHLAARSQGGNAEGIEGTIVPDAQACFLPPSVAQSEGVEIWGVRRKK